MLSSQVGPGAFVPIWLLKKKINPAAIVMWAIMRAQYADHLNSLNPSRGELAADLGISKDTVDRHMKELRESGAINIKPHTLGGQRIPNEYVLIEVEGSSGAAATVAAEDRPSQLASMLVETPIPFIKKTKRERGELVRTKVPVRFGQFWQLYPRKCEKQETLRIWLRDSYEQDTPLFDAVMAGLRRHVAVWEQEGRPRRYLPYPDKFLRRKIYLDEIEPEAVSAQSKHTQSIVEASQMFLERHATKGTP